MWNLARGKIGSAGLWEAIEESGQETRHMIEQGCENYAVAGAFGSGKHFCMVGAMD